MSGILELRNGPEKKFKLIKLFGATFRVCGIEPAPLSCEEIHTRAFGFVEQLARAARPLNDDDYGSEEQVEHENDFFAVVRELLTEEQEEALETFSLKATTEERIDEALRLVAEYGR